MCYLFLRVASEVVHAHCKQKLDAAAQLLESVWDEVVQQAGDCCWKSLEVVVNDAVTNLSCKQAEFVCSHLIYCPFIIFVWAYMHLDAALLNSPVELVYSSLLVN